MKKLLSLLLALVLVFSLVACSNNGETTAETNQETQTETAGETAGETAEETQTETPATTGDIAQIALGTSVSLGASKDLSAQSDVTIAALALDSEGKIVKAHIDVAQSKVPVTEAGVVEAPTEFKTKQELQDDYGMRKASGIKAEWYEQANSFADYIVGKTIDEVVAIPTQPSEDGSHPNVPSDADLLASVTMDIGAMQKAVADAKTFVKDAAGATQLGLGVNTQLGSRTANAEGEEPASVQFETTVAVNAIDADGKIVATILDTAQNSVQFNADGTLAEGQSTEGTTKRHLGDEYGMKKASPIGKEWDEQIEGLENYLVTMTKDQVSGIELTDGAPTTADLLATTTMAIPAYQATVVKSFDVVK